MESFNNSIYENNPKNGVLTAIEDFIDESELDFSFEVLNAAATNTSNGNGIGAMLTAGIGLGAGIPLGQQIGQRIQISNKEVEPPDPLDKLRKLKLMYDQNLITEEIFNRKRDQIISEM